MGAEKGRDFFDLDHIDDGSDDIDRFPRHLGKGQGRTDEGVLGTLLNESAFIDKHRVYVHLLKQVANINNQDGFPVA